jgi:hypothetical protein
MRLAFPFIAPLLLLSACAEEGGGPSERAEAAFERELAGRTAGEPRSCIPAGAGRRLVVRDSRTIVQDEGRTLWVSRLDRPCPGLDPFGTLEIQAQGGQYCSGDRVRGLEAGRTIPGPWCVLRDFTPYRLP